MAKSKYYTHVKPNLTLVAGWCRDGAIDEEIWKRLKISKTSFYKYQNEHEDFSNALKNNKEIVDYKVEESLLDSATGYIKTLRKPFKLKEIYYNEEGKRCEKETIVFAEEEVFYPAIPVSIIYWLKNRKRDKWRDKPEEKGDSIPPVIVVNTLPGGDKIGN